MDNDSNEAAAGDLQNKKPPTDGNPVAERAEVEATAREFLSNRSRVVAAAVVAVVWGVLVSESKLSVPVEPSWKKPLIVAASLSILTLLLDYCQYLLEYLDAKVLGGKYMGKGGRMMFVTKQVATVVSAGILIVTASFIVLRATKTEAQQPEVWDIYDGYVWSQPNQSDKRVSRLYLGQPNPITGFTKASEDGVGCKGTAGGTRLVLVCDNTAVRFDGILESHRSYKGEWTVTSTQPLNGHFSYVFKKQWKKP